MVDRIDRYMPTTGPLTTVVNLDTQDEQAFSIPPREAVIAAYAQSKDDWDTWDYEEKYGAMVRVHPSEEEAKRRGSRTWNINQFAAVERLSRKLNTHKSHEHRKLKKVEKDFGDVSDILEVVEVVANPDTKKLKAKLLK